MKEKNWKTRKNSFLCICLCALLAFGCGNSSSDQEKPGDTARKILSGYSATAGTEESQETHTLSNQDQELSTEGSTDATGQGDREGANASSGQTGNSSQTSSSFDVSQIPAYAGTASVTVNGNIPYFTEEEKTRTDPFETYSDLDALGRCGVAYANICKELQPTEERGEIGEVKPSGWKTVKYNDYIEGNYLYNRCHLIGFQLAGENANEKNLITGTRYMNVQGMLPYEDNVDEYVDATGNHVLYRVTPIFQGENLVASGVLMEGWSVEDGGEGLSFCVYCYNVQPHIGIDYATGNSWVSDDTTGWTGSEGESAGSTAGETENSSTGATSENGDTGLSTSGTSSETADSGTTGETRTFILNTNTKKFHLPTCSSVSRMSDSNKETYAGTAADLESMGYEPCKNCNPDL